MVTALKMLHAYYAHLSSARKEVRDPSKDPFHDLVQQRTMASGLALAKKRLVTAVPQGSLEQGGLHLVAGDKEARSRPLIDRLSQGHVPPQIRGTSEKLHNVVALLSEQFLSDGWEDG